MLLNPSFPQNGKTSKLHNLNVTKPRLEENILTVSKQNRSASRERESNQRTSVHDPTPQVPHDSMTTQDNVEKTVIQDLPNNVVKHILSFLDVRGRLRAELVCKKWRLIGTLLPWENPTELIFTTDLNSFSLGLLISNLSDQTLGSLLYRCRCSLQKLVLSYETPNPLTLTTTSLHPSFPKSLSMMSQYCSKLQTLKLEGIHMDEASLLAIANGCSKLQDLSLCPPAQSDCSQGAVAIVRNCPKLASLALSNMSISHDWFDTVNYQLRSLHLSFCIPFSPISTLNLVTNCESLENLSLQYCGKSVEEVAAQFGIVYYFRRTLKYLNLVFDSSLLQDLNWSYEMRNLYNLEELHLQFAEMADDKLVEVLVQDCPKLHTLVIPGSSVTDHGAALLSVLPLKKLSIGFNGHVTCKGLKRLVDKGQVEKLSVVLMPFITEDFCCKLAIACPMLHCLDVSGNRNISNRLVKAFRLAIQMGSLRTPVKLMVGGTRVSPYVAGHDDGLNLDFSTNYKAAKRLFDKIHTLSEKLNKHEMKLRCSGLKQIANKFK